MLVIIPMSVAKKKKHFKGHSEVVCVVQLHNWLFS